ncbi:LAFE_0G00518g1_1 [Lachancea fermentati]|uniref:LAFE_0G00518g1_1 n=1 Tax=Lachancea fermentati TaxID=4955 RepID=A0A1G4MGH7_LACFM|nr:LAFE_0G00518g1_1 [Lachancea fermentati]
MQSKGQKPETVNDLTNVDHEQVKSITSNEPRSKLGHNNHLRDFLDLNQVQTSRQQDMHAQISADTFRHLTQETSIRSPIRKVHSQDYFSITPSNTNYGAIDELNSSFHRKDSTCHRSHTSNNLLLETSSHNVPVQLSEEGISRNFYDDFTSVDWVRDYLYDVKEREKLSSIPHFRGKIERCFNSLQDWILITLVAFGCSLIAFVIDKSEELLVDLKRGFCVNNIFLNQQQCCSNHTCANWKLWPEIFKTFDFPTLRADFIVYLILSLVLAYLSVLVTLTTKVDNPLASKANNKKFRTMYSAYGSGVPEVKTILSGFVIRKFLGTYTLFSKSVALIFAIASGMSLGKEGPYVHLATCVGNILSRIFDKFQKNGIERRVILSASAAAGVTLAFGSPLGGVLFSLEEVSYYLPGNQLFKTFFCAIMSNLFLRLFDPYSTGKAVLFEVSYESDWQYSEIPLYVTIGAVGGVFGAYFCKFVSWWGDWFRKTSLIKYNPVREVLLIALLTAFMTFWNSYTNISVAELLANLASPCYSPNDFTGTSGLCPINTKNFPSEIVYLLYALFVKVVLTGITFGIKVPAGIYVPSMVIGALFGRIFAMSFQYLGNHFPSFVLFSHICNSTMTDGICVDLGIYAMISAGAFMAGVTRMNVTLAIIMFELTSSYNYVVPISIAIAVSNLIGYIIEPQSVYEMLIRKNDLPYLDNHKSHNFRNHERDLADIITKVDERRGTMFVDVSKSVYFSSSTLRTMLSNLQKDGLVDGCLPVLNNKKLAGVLPAPELELALDKLQLFAEEYQIKGDILVRLLDNSTETSFDDLNESERFATLVNNVEEDSIVFSNIEEKVFILQMLITLCDFRHITERSPIFLDINSPLSLVELIFTKLGNRSISITDNGVFVGFLHKKSFIDHCHKQKIL